jgi:hypothetical protein
MSWSKIYSHSLSLSLFLFLSFFLSLPLACQLYLHNIAAVNTKKEETKKISIKIGSYYMTQVFLHETWNWRPCSGQRTIFTFRSKPTICFCDKMLAFFDVLMSRSVTFTVKDVNYVFILDNFFVNFSKWQIVKNVYFCHAKLERLNATVPRFVVLFYFPILNIRYPNSLTMTNEFSNRLT